MYLFGRKFTLRTDHKPLLKIFAPDSATPVLAAARLQRWSVLSSYHYEIEFKSSAEVASAEALKRLPLQYRKDASVEEEIFHVAPQQLKRHPVSAAEITKDTSRNPLLAKALLLTQNGRMVGLLRGSFPKSVPLDFGLEKTFALYFYHQHYYPS